MLTPLSRVDQTTDGIEISLRALDPLVTKRIVRFQKYVIDTGCTNHMGVKPGDMAYIDPFGRCPNIRETGILLADGRVVSAKAYPVQARLVDRSSLPKVPVSGFHWVWATTHPLQDRLCNPLEWRGLYMCSWPPARILTAPDRAWPLPMFEMAFGSVKGAVTALAPAGRGDM